MNGSAADQGEQDAASDPGRVHPGRVYGSVNAAVFERVPIRARHVLDIGCGDGQLGSALKLRTGCSVTGVTASQEELIRATLALDKVVHADLDAADLSSLGRFDAVVCSHVLEHLRDPRRVLSQLRSNLQADGLLIVALPNVLLWRQRLAFLGGRFRYTAGGIMDDTHLRFFDWTTARQLVETAGYRLVEAVAEGGFPGSRFLPGFLGKRVDRLVTSSNPGLFGVQFIVTARVRSV